MVNISAFSNSTSTMSSSRMTSNSSQSLEANMGSNIQVQQRQPPQAPPTQLPAALSCLHTIFDLSNDQSNKKMLHGAIVVAFIVIQCLGAAGILSGVVTGTATITSVIFLGTGMKLLAGIKDANSWSWKVLLDNPPMEAAFIILSLFTITGYVPGMFLGVTNVIILCGNLTAKRLMHKCAPSCIPNPDAEEEAAQQQAAAQQQVAAQQVVAQPEQAAAQQSSSTASTTPATTASS